MQNVETMVEVLHQTATPRSNLKQRPHRHEKKQDTQNAFWCFWVHVVEQCVFLYFGTLQESTV